MEFFKNNLINWIVLVGLVAWLWLKVMPGIFAERKKRIQTAIDEAARAKRDSEQFLLEQRQRIENAEKEAARIVEEAKKSAADMKADADKETQRLLGDLEKKIEQQISTHRQMVITELRSQAATAAVHLAEASLPGAITSNVKQGLQERFVSQLDQIGTIK